MHETEIKQQCKITWAHNLGLFGKNEDQGAPNHTPTRQKIRGYLKGKKNLTDKEKTELRFQAKYHKSLKVTSIDKKPSMSSDNKIAKGLQAGKILSNIAASGLDVEMWAVLAYKEETIERKKKLISYLVASIQHNYCKSRQIEGKKTKLIYLIVVYQLVNILNEYDARFKRFTQEKAFRRYKNPSDFAKHHAAHMYNIEQIIRGLDKRAKQV